MRYENRDRQASQAVIPGQLQVYSSHQQGILSVTHQIRLNVYGFSLLKFNLLPGIGSGEPSCDSAREDKG